MSNVELDLGPVWWSFGSGSSPRHISLGAGAPPNGQDGGAASAAVIEELESFFAVHGGATKTGSVAPAPASHKEPSARSPSKRALSQSVVRSVSPFIGVLFSCMRAQHKELLDPFWRGGMFPMLYCDIG